MPKRVKISTKTTRNKEFNGYVTGDGSLENPYVLNTVASTTATKDNPNIRLLDVNQGVAKSGKEIKADALQNMTLIEGNTGLDTKTALIVANFALHGRPTDPVAAALYDKLAAALASEDLTFDKIKETMLINYDNTVLKDSTTYYIYGSPEQQVLNNRQHYNNCGIESTLNNLAMAGIIKMKENLSDQEKVEKSFLQSVWERNLAGDFGQVGVLDEPDGGTLVDDYRDILEYFGIDAHSYYITNKCDGYVYPKEQLKELAYKISQGHGAVLGLSSSKLWNDVQSETGKVQIDHAVAITGVVYDADGPVQTDEEGHITGYNTPVGFYIHDTGAWMTRFISYKDFVDVTLCDYVYGETATDTTLPSLKEYDSKTDTYILKSQQGIFVAITDEPIKTDVFNLDATGDKYDNIIWGNSSDNVIKGMKGNDTLYGGAGRDTLSGDAGNDTIVGNNAFTFTANLQNPHVSLTYNTIDDFMEYLGKSDVLDLELTTRLNSINVVDYGTKEFTDFAKAYEYIREKIPNGINTLDGGAGNDIIIGGEQADLIYGGKGNDYIYGGDGRNAIYGGANDDVIVGGYDNDRLFGDAGNDFIYGLDDMDIIDGGAGNDIIFGGRDSDIIETGKGNDMVYFEGNEFGQDMVMSKAGGTILKFVGEGDPDDVESFTPASKVSDFFFSLKDDEENDKVKNLTVQYRQGNLEDDETGITFGNYLTIKSGKAKSLYVADEDGIYTTAVSKKAKATVTNTKETGSVKIFGQSIANKDINNILMTTYEGAKITTSIKNDIVTMINNGNPTILSDKVDKIEYTGGKDKYVSEDRNTYYTAGALGDTTNLSIYDNVIGVTKVIIPEEGDPQVIDNYASTDDKLYTTTDKTNVKLFFDVKKGAGTNGYTTSNGGFYLLTSTNMEASTFTNIAKGNELNGGFIYMDSFFGYDKEHDAGLEIENSVDPAFYGNGRIEHIICDNSEFNYTESVANIASAVAGWLAESDYSSAFDVFNSNDLASKDVLAQIYEAQGNV